MIIQRLSKGIKNQDWFVVMVEVMIVVVGIFIGLQVDDWSQSQKDRQLEKQYLVRLVSDMERSDVAQKQQMERLEVLMAPLDIVAGSLQSSIKHPGFDAAFKIVWDDFGASARPLTNTGTLSELKSSGRLLLIKDNKTRVALSDLEQSLTLTKDKISNIQRAIISTFNIIRPYFADLNRKGQAYKTTPEKFKKMASDDAFVAAFSTYGGFLHFSLISLKSHNDVTLGALKQLKNGDLDKYRP